uniref:Uncharacterized protein n=1 Tax=Tanacetum cinerariifolium TaxID=118510 RepID=A0A699JK31_TANCI|nr:hypothetical protein [Tanacetum cinerariifolium]
MVLSLEQIKTNQAVKIEKLKKRVKKLEGMKKKRNHGLKRLYKVGLSTRVESSEEEEDLGDQEDASKQRRIAEIDDDEDLSLINETIQDRGRINKEDLFRDAIVAKKEVSTAANEVVTTADDAEITTATITIQISKDDVTIAQTLMEIKAAKPKARGVIVQEHKPEKPLKKKDQIAIDEKIARKLEAHMKAEMEEEERIARGKVEANIAVVNTFVDMNTEMVEERSKKTQVEVTEDSSKRAGDEIEKESAKRQRLKKEDDSAKMKRCLEIVPEDDDDVTIEETPLSSKSPTIVDYKIYKQGKKSYFRIIRADRNSQNYLTFEKMFKNFNREDLKVLRSIVKERFKKTKPLDDMDNLLFQTLKTMFKHHVEDNIWKYQQGAVKVHNWKRFDSCGVSYVRTQNMVYYLLVEKMYPFTNNILHQMWKYVRLQVDYEVEMAYNLLRLIRW